MAVRQYLLKAENLLDKRGLGFKKLV